MTSENSNVKGTRAGKAVQKLSFTRLMPSQKRQIGGVLPSELAATVAKMEKRGFALKGKKRQHGRYYLTFIGNK